MIQKSPAFLAIALGLAAPAAADDWNLKVVTDASPDYSSLDDMIRSIASRWPTPEEKCWAIFYWNHIARRQTSPMILHGLELADPIRQFNDYGYAQCSTVAGINCSIWDAMGFPVRYWDIILHTVPEVQYGGRWHMYDNSMSAIYTLCDGKTIAGVEDIGKEGGCPASGGKVEPGHIARRHCLTATSADGFLTGADCDRDLAQEFRCFSPKGLKLRHYYHDWDRGHRYILDLRENEVYARRYRSLGDGPEHYVPNGGKDPDGDHRLGLRGNGVRTWKPSLEPEAVGRAAERIAGLRAVAGGGLEPEKAGGSGEVVFKVEGANVIASLAIRGTASRRGPGDRAAVAVSATNGLAWKEVWAGEGPGAAGFDLKLVEEVSGAYEVLVKVTLLAAGDPAGVRLGSLEMEAITQLNAKTQPRLLLGRNTVHVGLGEQTESIVVWPDLRAGRSGPWVVEERNIAAEAEHPGYMGVLHTKEPGEGHAVFRIDAPRPIRRVVYGGRFCNRAPKSRIDLLHSFDGGKSWTRSWSLDRTDPPWDVIRYETVRDVPAGATSVLVKVALASGEAGPAACSVYALRMEVDHDPPDATFRPVEVTFSWGERQADGSLVPRSHTEVATAVPHRYSIAVGGIDHPVMDALRVSLRGAVPGARPGYSDGKDPGGEKFVGRWVTCGRNLARGKPYTVSVPTKDSWGAGDPDGKKLTDGIVGPPYPGGRGPTYGLAWDKGMEPAVTVDLGAVESCAAFRIQVGAGWPWWDALKGEVKDRVEVQTSEDGKEYVGRGRFDLNLRRADIPVNHMIPDDETLCGHLYTLAPERPVAARYVRWRIIPERTLTVSEVEVLDSLRSEPFDLRIALPER